VANADYLLSFGAPFLEHWLSPVLFGHAFGHFRQGRPGVRGRFTQIEPRLSLTAASADRWIPVRPGTEGLVALGIAKVMLREGWTRSDIPRRTLAHWLDPYRVEEIAAASDVAREDLISMADEFAHAPAPLAIGGGMASAHTNGSRTMAAINALNVLAGNLDKPGGLRRAESPSFPNATASPLAAAERDVAELAAGFKAGRYTMLQLYRANPLFTMPPSSGIRDLFEHARFTVSFSSFLDESTAMADLILPDHSPLESWGDHPQAGLIPEHAVGLSQPVVNPLYDTRNVGDVLLHAAHDLGEPRDHARPEDGFLGVLRSNWKSLLSRKDGSAAGFEAAWVRCLQEGGSWSTPPRRASLPRPELSPSYRPAVFAGEADEYPFYFYPFPSLSLSRGEGANLPWLQELPDTLSTAVWGSWLEMNPATARRLGLKAGELVRVTSPYGHVEAPLILSPGMRPDLVAGPMGQGHDAYGRYAARRGINPVAILAPLFDEESGTLATAATRVRVEGTGRPGKLVLMERVPKDGETELLTIHKPRKV
jgi:anaerobic selenocysteine-containing dehydrogenase